MDFKWRSTDGMGDDWPITYEEIAPYYDKVESYIGVFGTKENISSAPDGVFLPPPVPRCTDTIVKKACDKVNVTCIPSRMAIITKPLNGRAACHYCGQCGRGCVTASNFSSSQVMIPPAQATGRFTLITGAMAREIVVGKDGKAQAVSYVDKATRTEKRVNAKAFVIGASACESARLLLNSRSTLFPDGLANSSGVVGRYLTDTVGSSAGGYFPQLEKMPPTTTTASAACICTCPGGSSTARTTFCAAITLNSAAGATCPGSATSTEFANVRRLRQPLKQQMPQQLRHLYWFRRPRRDDSQRKLLLRARSDTVDQWGIPVLRFHWQWSDNEIKMAKDMQQTFRAIVEAAGGTYISRAKPDDDHPYGIDDGGVIIHEIGSGAHGKQSQDLRAQQILPGPRREESFRD